MLCSTLGYPLQPVASGESNDNYHKGRNGKKYPEWIFGYKKAGKIAHMILQRFT